ncbi:MAG: SIMPL domain-containing protein [Methanothrix sp.]|nr:SIMPL domain-containing protein [Methanothrix sp.]
MACIAAKLQETCLAYAVMLYGLLTSNRPPGTWAWRGTNALVVGRVLDAAVSAGSNTIQEVTFDLKDAQPQQDLALTMAIEDARRKAMLRLRQLA